VFHCLHAAEQGGDTVLVDGFECATQLKNENPAAFKLLSKRRSDIDAGICGPRAIAGCIGLHGCIRVAE
ncbi:hypothetical protein TELCIR_19452, partial [Teladorsagia circumcincta]